MLRQATLRTVRTHPTPLSTIQPRTFTTVAARLAAGDTGSGSSRPMGQAQGYASQIIQSCSSSGALNKASLPINLISCELPRALTISCN